MTRLQYALHVLGRLLESAAIAAAAAFLYLRLGHPPPGWHAWAGSALSALVAHVLLGPKQTRPVFLRLPGAAYCYAGIRLDRNAACRGGLTTGATGSGKTLACLLPRLHSLCVNEPGAENLQWRERGLPRYAAAPWGGLVCGEKGNEWRWVTALLAAHGRGGDVRLLQTRPPEAPDRWQPPARLNLLGRDRIPADTYAQLLVDTALAVEAAEKPDEFFVAQARDKMAWGIRLLRAAAGRHPPTLVALHRLLTTPEGYLAVLEERGIGGESGDGLPAGAAEARARLEQDYWGQPPEQLGGVRSTIGNFLAPYTEAEFAEVFCTASTFELGEIEQGRVLCLALPQRHAVQRRYATALLKGLVFQVILARFDAGDRPEGRNLLLVEQDEWQRYALRADGEVDVLREAEGTMYAATQSQNAVWARFGGRERASPVLANLRNRWICQGATDECAEESARAIGERVSRQLSRSSGAGGGTVTVSFVERPFLSKARLRSLAPFEVCYVPAEGPVLFVRGIAMPVTAEGGIPPWWFGDWNAAHWLAAALGFPEVVAGGLRLYDRRRLIPPWRARAPLRAQVRRLLGLDGTFITRERVRVRRAARLARGPGDR